MKKQEILRAIRGLSYYIRGHIIAWLHYDKKYIKGKWFQGRYGGICAVGWEWVVNGRKGCKKMGVNQNVPWPISPFVRVIYPENITFHENDLNNFNSYGIYFQAIGKIDIGEGTFIGPNVGIITSNHTIGELDKHDDAKPVIIGKNCWIGMNSVILPGVVLGDNTIVGAGSVVTKSFPEGNCVLTGVPAVVSKKIDKGQGEEDAI